MKRLTHQPSVPPPACPSGVPLTGTGTLMFVHTATRRRTFRGASLAVVVALVGVLATACFPAETVTIYQSAGTNSATAHLGEGLMYWTATPNVFARMYIAVGSCDPVFPGGVIAKVSYQQENGYTDSWEGLICDSHGKSLIPDAKEIRTLSLDSVWKYSDGMAYGHDVTVEIRNAYTTETPTTGGAAHIHLWITTSDANPTSRVYSYPAPA